MYPGKYDTTRYAKINTAAKIGINIKAFFIFLTTFHLLFAKGEKNTLYFSTVYVAYASISPRRKSIAVNTIESS